MESQLLSDQCLVARGIGKFDHREGVKLETTPNNAKLLNSRTCENAAENMCTGVFSQN